MARQTAAEKRAEADAAKVAEFTVAAEAYPHRLMTLMAQYSEIHNYAFSIHTHVPLSFEFTVRDSDGDVRFDAVLAAELASWNMYYELENAERKVEEHYAEEAERERRYQVLSNAQAKLKETFNTEELQLLGLK